MTSFTSTESMPQAPAWVQEQAPAWAAGFVGHRALPEPFASRTELLARTVGALDFWQANHFIVHREETAQLLYSRYTPLKAEYQRGTLPAYEALVDHHLQGLTDDRARGLRLLQVQGQVLPHPTVPPLGPHCPPNRNLEDEALLASGTGFCNEQARVFVRLCQVAGIPARMVFLFYSNPPKGHVVAEFHDGEGWIMVDVSWQCVVADDDGQLLSAAQCHEARHAAAVGRAFHSRAQQLLAMSDEELVGRAVAESAPVRRQEELAKIRENLQGKTFEFCSQWLWKFGLLNYPLPR